MTDSPTVVLVHGAFADASGFAGVITELEAAGHAVVAPANPLRGLVADATAIQAVVAAIEGPVVLVGHSYGGAVITQASATLSNVTALVYLAGFGIDEVESCASVQAPFRRRCSRRTAWRRPTRRPERPTAQACTSLPMRSIRSSAPTHRRRRHR
jgi:pimeloyl-ACP methyl ester carboxylesterase